MSNILDTIKKEVLKWLFSPHDGDHRATGRTTMLANVFIDIAKENPGTKIVYFDHDVVLTNVRRSKQYMRGTIADHVRGRMLENREYEKFEITEEYIIYRR